jgi:2-isopropylmalate synthase
MENKKMNNMEMKSQKVIFFDTTLRDGLQAVEGKVSNEVRLQIARRVRDLGVDVIEAGFPIASEEIYDSVYEISKEIGTEDGPVICGLSRIVAKDIEASANAISPAFKRRIHTFCATSEIHMRDKLKKSPEWVLLNVPEMIQYARNFTEDIEFSLEDFGRTEDIFAIEVVKKAIKAGATTINLPDTVGYLRPNRFFEKVNYVITNIQKQGLDAIFSVHTHNDRGLATATTIAGLEAGAIQAEVTINGIGERAGNAALEEIVANLRMGDIYNSITGEKLYSSIIANLICPISKDIARLTGINVQANKAVTGANAFLHSSGIHQDGCLKNKDTYEIMTPEEFGAETKFGMSDQSGRHAVKDRYKSLGIEFKTEEHFQEVSSEFFKILSQKSGKPDDVDFIQAYCSKDVPYYFELISYTPVKHDDGSCGTDIKMRTDKSIVIEYGRGNGLVDAAVTAIKNALGIDATIKSFKVEADGEGSSADGFAYTIIRKNGWEVHGTANTPDIVESGIRAFIEGCNRIRYLEDFYCKREM